MNFTSRFTKAIDRLLAIGAVATDDEETRLGKSLLVIVSIPFIVAGAVWGFMYIGYGATLAGIIPLTYSIVSPISLVLFAITRKFGFYRFSQLLLILLLPFALMLSLGGFVSGSAVIIWSILATLGAMLFDKQSRALPWLIAFIGLVVLSYFIQPFLGIETVLTNQQVQMFFVINLATVGALIFMMVYYFVGKMNFFKARSEALLLNILPKDVADELKATGTTKTKRLENVTVMFTDFKDFTQITEKLSPEGLVELINHCFTAFDEIIAKHNVEKIKTIGDAYMCAGGLPVPNNTHAVDVVNAALEIRDFMAAYGGEQMQKQLFEIRVGVHTGPVVAGIVGLRKFAYDIWGDTVNVASRMESSGEAGRVNISGSTYELVKDNFNCSHRGKINAKHKGEIDMYFVERN